MVAKDKAAHKCQEIILECDSSVSGPNNLAIGMTTIGIRTTIEDVLASYSRFLPDATIYVVDQSGNRDFEQLYVAYGVRVIWADADIGLSAARNLLVNQVEEQYLLITDDDDYAAGRPPVESFIQILQESPDTVAIGARHASKGRNASYASYLYRPLDSDNLVMLYRADSGPPDLVVNGLRFLRVETITNTAIFDRRRLLHLGLLWDERLKIWTEHLDFYLQMQKIGVDLKRPLNVLYCPDWQDVSIRGSGRNPAYRSRRVNRSGEYGELFSAKWGITRRIRVYPDGHVQVDQFSNQNRIKRLTDAVISLAEQRHLQVSLSDTQIRDLVHNSRDAPSMRAVVSGPRMSAVMFLLQVGFRHARYVCLSALGDNSVPEFVFRSRGKLQTATSIGPAYFAIAVESLGPPSLHHGVLYSKARRLIIWVAQRLAVLALLSSRSKRARNFASRLRNVRLLQRSGESR